MSLPMVHHTTQYWTCTNMPSSVRKAQPMGDMEGGPCPVGRPYSHGHGLCGLLSGLALMSFFAWCLGWHLGEEEVKWEMPKQTGRTECSSYHFQWWCPSPWSCAHTWPRNWRSWGPGQQISSKSACHTFLDKTGSKTITHTWVCDNSWVIFISI